jgi:hypothetical protein
MIYSHNIINRNSVDKVSMFFSLSLLTFDNAAQRIYGNF